MPDPRDNSEWITALRSSGTSQSEALADLRELLVSGLRHGLSRWLEPYSPELGELVEDSAQEALIRIIDRLDTFEGRSKFTTWAYKVAINLALSELRRKQWQDLSLEEMLEPKSEDQAGRSLMGEESGPEKTVEQRELMARIGVILEDELSPRQLALMKAVAIQRIPIEAIAQKMGVKRNALYKMMHDARLKLKRRIALEGLDLEDVMASFEHGNTSQGRIV